MGAQTAKQIPRTVSIQLRKQGEARLKNRRLQASFRLSNLALVFYLSGWSLAQKRQPANHARAKSERFD